MFESTRDRATPESLSYLVSRQVQNLHPNFDPSWEIAPSLMAEALVRTQVCVSHLKPAAGAPARGFDPLISGHHATLLYFLSRHLAAIGALEDATRVFLTNKALHGIDLFHEVEMHPVFGIGHTVGMVFAKATYGPRCIFHQGCTVGRDGHNRPVLEEGVVMYPNAAIIGGCHVRANTVIAPGVQLVNTDTPGDCIVFLGDGGRPTFKPVSERYADRYLHSLGTVHV